MTSNVGMSLAPTCPKCRLPLGGTAVDGLCPNCLGNLALDQTDDQDELFQTLLHRALAISNPKSRREFLTQACGEDSALMQRIQDRLQPPAPGGPAPTQFLGPMPNSDGPALPMTEKPGDGIGPYRLLESIGEGGFGVVYAAEQLKPVRRRVALKILKLGMDTRAVVARFEAERQALAMMDHPHIAKVLDAGATQTGRPYFVMELVKGIPITEYCDQQRFTTKQRLELFIQVCQAIQHAHQKGIIHRDIKPSNILVGDHDSGPMPKVIDFGIAKATDLKLTDKTIHTAVNQFIGTPAYVSPEQAEMSGLDIDTRADIYSLGVVLYKLLIGRTPFDSKELVESGLDEMLRTIREKDPLQPSTRVTRLDKPELEQVAANHQADPGKFAGRLRGDLDWITMKALEKDRNRRYDTANGLAQDLQRHLNNEPVTAAAPTAGYRMQKLVRRNKGLFVGIAAVLGVSLIGTAFSAWQAIRANDQARRAGVAQAETLVQLDAKNYEEGKAWMERAEGYLGEKNYFYAKLMAARAIGFERFGRDTLPASRQAALPPLLPTDSPEAQKARFLLHGADFAQVWCSPTFTQHTNIIPGLAYSPNGELLASASWDCSVRLWNVKSGDLIREFKAATKAWSVAFSPDGSLLAVGYEGGAVQMWDVARGASKAVMIGVENGSVSGLAINRSGTMLAAATFGNIIRLYDVPSGQTNASLTTRTGSLGQIVFTPDGRFLAAGFQSDAVPTLHGTQLWDLATRRLHREFPGPEAVFAVAVSPKGDLLATGDSVGTVRIWNVNDGTLKASLPGHSNYIHSVDFSPDGLHLISASSDGFLILWDVARGQSRARYTQRGGEVLSARFSPDGRVLASGHQDGSIRFLRMDAMPPGDAPKAEGHSCSLKYVGFTPDGRGLVSSDELGNTLVWDLGASTVKTRVGSGKEWLAHAAVDPNGQYFAAGFRNGTLHVYDLASNAFRWEMPGSSALTEIAFTPDGQTVIAGMNNGMVSERSSSSGELRGEFQAHPQAGFVHVAVSPDGALLATGSETHRNLRLMGLPGGKLLHEFNGHSRELTAVAFSPSGRYVSSGSRDGSVLIWDVASRQLHKELPGHVASVGGLTFSPHGNLLATADQGGALRLWDVATGRLEVRWQYSGTCSGIAFHPEESLLALASTDGTVQMWELMNANTEIALAGHASAIRSLAFSRDGKELISAGDQGRIVSWDLAAGQIHREFLGHTNNVHTVALSPDQLTVAAGDERGTLRLWDRATGRQSAEFRDQTNRLFSLTFSPDGTLLASGSEDSTVRTWDLARGEIKFLFTNHYPDAVRAVSFSHDGASLLSADVAGDIIVWSTVTGQVTQKWTRGFGVQCVASAFSSPMMAVGGTDGQTQLLRLGRGRLPEMPSHPWLVHSLAFSPDDTLLASASEDGTVQMLDTRTSALLAHISDSSQAVYAVGFSPDGKTLAAAGGDGVIRLYNVAFTLGGSLNYARYMNSLKLDGRRVLSMIPNKKNHLYRVEPVPMQPISDRSILTVLRSGLTDVALDRQLFQRFMRAGNLVSASLLLERHGGEAWKPERESLGRAYLREAAAAKGYGAEGLAKQYDAKGRRHSAPLNGPP